MDFDATLDLDGRTATGITVPPEIIDALGAGKRPAVVVTINGCSFPMTIGSMNGLAKIPVSAERRRLLGVEAGAALSVSVVLDDAPVEPEVPPELIEALATDRVSREFFASLTPSQRRGFIAAIDGAKSADTRQRRVEKVVAAVEARQKRL